MSNAFVPSVCLKLISYIRFSFSRNFYLYQILRCLYNFHLCGLDSETVSFSFFDLVILSIFYQTVSNSVLTRSQTLFRLCFDITLVHHLTFLDKSQSIMLWISKANNCTYNPLNFFFRTLVPL
jgi:hypothetical protein